MYKSLKVLEVSTYLKKSNYYTSHVGPAINSDVTPKRDLSLRSSYNIWTVYMYIQNFKYVINHTAVSDHMYSH